jgi:hypothetical protein
LKKRQINLPDEDTRFLIDTNLFIAATKSGWTKSTDLIFRHLERPWEIAADDILILENEKYGSSLFHVGKSNSSFPVLR